MVKKVGILVRDLLLSQQAFLLINQLNEFAQRHDHDAYLFCENRTPCCIPSNIPILNPAEIWKFDGLVIATNLNNAKLTIETVANIKKVFYVWDLEWLRHSKNFEENVDIYRNIQLIAPSQEYAEALGNYANIQDPCVIPNFNIQEIVNEFC